MWNTSPNLLVESEQLLYPLESLVGFFFLTLLMSPWPSQVAEFGGTLGLFLGFSFMALWDGVTEMGAMVRKIKCLTN